MRALDAFADELARLPPSIETTGLELRFAMLQAMAERRLNARRPEAALTGLDLQ
jgi:hypothetical protein